MEILHQRYKLTDVEQRWIGDFLRELPPCWPTNVNTYERYPLVDWKWNEGTVLGETTAHAVYKQFIARTNGMLSWIIFGRERMWSIFGEKGAIKCGRAPLFQDTTFGLLSTGTKLRHWEAASRSCPWWKCAKETLMQFFWLHPNLRGF